MTRLRHLYLPQLIDAYGWEFRLSELETFDGFKSDICKDWNNELSTMIKLRYFRGNFFDSCPSNKKIDRWVKASWVKISVERKKEPEPESIEELLRCSNLNDLEVYDIAMDKLPQYEPQYCRNLIWLELFKTGMSEESRELLKKLPSLQFLQELILHSDSFLGNEITSGSTDFPQLKSLILFRLPNLKIWRLDEGALPNLSTFEITHCKKLKIVPRNGLSQLRNLKDFIVGDGMPENFKLEHGMHQS